MMRARTKFYFGLCGADALLTIMGVMYKSYGMAFFAFCLLLFSWYVAHELLDGDAELLMKKIEGRE
jgi:hypothetical protein